MDRTELGAALKDWRARLRPSDVGLPAGTRRRTPGLRHEEVARLWAQRPVQARHSNRRRFAHPQVGELELDCDVLAAPGDDQVLIVYSAAPVSPAASALALLRVIGVEPLSATSGRHA